MLMVGSMARSHTITHTHILASLHSASSQDTTRKMQQYANQGREKQMVRMKSCTAGMGVGAMILRLQLGCPCCGNSMEKQKVVLRQPVQRPVA